MLTNITRLKIIAVGPEQKSVTTKKTIRKVLLTVAEVPAHDPFGEDRLSPQFEVEVYNSNIERFGVGNGLVGRMADCCMDIRFYQADLQAMASPKFIVTELVLRK